MYIHGQQCENEASTTFMLWAYQPAGPKGTTITWSSMSLPLKLDGPIPQNIMGTPFSNFCSTNWGPFSIRKKNI